MRTEHRRISEQIYNTLSWPFQLFLFPGVIAHEAAHVVACKCFGVRIKGVSYFNVLELHKPIGYVVYDDIPSLRLDWWVGVAPLFLNTALSVLSFSMAVVGGEADPSSVLLWLGCSFAFHAIPSSLDMEPVRIALTKKGDNLSFNRALVRMFLKWHCVIDSMPWRFFFELANVITVGFAAVQATMQYGFRAIAVFLVATVVIGAVFSFTEGVRTARSVKREAAPSPVEASSIERLWELVLPWCHKGCMDGLPLNRPDAFRITQGGAISRAWVFDSVTEARQRRYIRLLLEECFEVGYYLLAATERGPIPRPPQTASTTDWDVAQLFVVRSLQRSGKLPHTGISEPIRFLLDGLAADFGKTLDWLAAPVSLKEQIMIAARQCIEEGCHLATDEAEAVAYVRQHGKMMDVPAREVMPNI